MSNYRDRLFHSPAEERRERKKRKSLCKITCQDEAHVSGWGCLVYDPQVHNPDCRSQYFIITSSKVIPKENFDADRYQVEFTKSNSEVKRLQLGSITRKVQHVASGLVVIFVNSESSLLNHGWQIKPKRCSVLKDLEPKIGCKKSESQFCYIGDKRYEYKHRKLVPKDNGSRNFSFTECCSVLMEGNDENIKAVGILNFEDNGQQTIVPIWLPKSNVQEILAASASEQSPASNSATEDTKPPNLQGEVTVNAEVGDRHDYSHDPPRLSFHLPKLTDLPKAYTEWNNVKLPIDILLLTVEDSEFLACFHYLDKPFKSYFRDIGPVYFGFMGNDNEKILKIALMKCSKGSSVPGGSLTVMKDAVRVLKPKAVFSVGACSGLDHEKTKLGDVVVSSTLTTLAHKTPPSRNISYLIRHAADGWNAPLEDPDIWKVKVHCNGDILSRPETISEEIIQQYPEAIAVEMEGEGVFAAAHDLNTEWILIKGIKDYANASQSSSDEWGVFASVMAASVVANILSDPVVFQEWPRSNQAQPTEDVNEKEDLDYHYEEYDSWLEMAKKDFSSFYEMVEKEQTDQQRRRINLFIARFQDVLPETYGCDGCDVELSTSGGRRYRCLHCVDVDLCYDCYMTGMKLEGHTENHELIEMRYKCSDCKQFILGTKFCCYKCPDFFLCIGCQSKHPVTHKVTKLPLKKAASASEQSSASNLAREDTKPTNLQEPLVVTKCQEQLKSYYDTFNKVKIVPWDDCSAVHIDEIYIPLSWVRDDRTPSGVTQEELKDYTDMFKGNKHHRKPTRMLVYGRPGIGKSTFCKKAAYDWSKALKEILMNFHIVLLIKLRDVCDLKDNRDVLRASNLLTSDGAISVDSLYEYIINNQDKVLLILDGYDEYSCAGKHSPIRDIWDGKLLRDCHVIVTTRHLKSDELRGPSHVQFEINGFKSSEQIAAFARKFLAGEKDVEEFMSYVEEKDLKGMAEIPLLLLMLCLVWNEKHHKGLPTSRTKIYTSFIQTMLDHKAEKDAESKQFRKVNEYREDLSKLGKLAFDALFQDCLFVRCSELHEDISSTLYKLIEVGLFQIVNITSRRPEKGAFFIHKSVQEFLAAWHINEEVLSMKGENTASLSEVDSLNKIIKMSEVLKFACELSAETASTVLGHLGFVGRKESLPEYYFSETPSLEDMSLKVKHFLTLISHSYFCCSAEKRRDLYSVFLSYTERVLFLDSDQANVAASEHLLKPTESPEFIFFSEVRKYSEQSYRDLITLTEDVNAVVVSCSGEKKAADFLKMHSVRPLHEFFLKKEKKMNLYVSKFKIWYRGHPDTFPTEMLGELISSRESTQKSGVCDQTNEQDINETASCLTENTDSTTGPTPHCLSCVKQIGILKTESQEMETLVEVLPFVTSPVVLAIDGTFNEVQDAQLTGTLVSRINFTNRLVRLALVDINLTARPAAVIARSLYQAPNLCQLDLSWNPLGEGVSVLSRHLRCVPRLEELVLDGVMMTKEQVNDLTTAVRQSNISFFRTSYHDQEGNRKPEDEWPTEEYWRGAWKFHHGSEDEPDPGSVTESDDEQEPGSVIESDGEQEPGS